MFRLEAGFRGLSDVARRLNLVSQRMKARVRVELDRAGWEGVRVARVLVPVKTGKLRSTIRFLIQRSTRGVLGFTGRLIVGTREVPYARYVEEGTRPHKIKAKNAEFLRWEDEDGDAHYAKEVSHPGTRPQPFLRPARRIMEGVLRERLKQMVKDVARGFRKAGG